VGYFGLSGYMGFDIVRLSEISVFLECAEDDFVLFE
jgi:hypothetical protein